MQAKSHERGQALVLIVFAIIGLFGITGLAVDGGMAYSDRRDAQNAADSAALTGALQFVRGHTDWSTIATNAASQNGYTSDGSNTTVAVSNPPAAGCNGKVWKPGPEQSDQHPNHYVQVVIHSTVHTYFAPVVGVRQVHNCVEAITLALVPINGNPFPGEAVIGLDPNGTSFQAQSNAQTWNIQGGGVFANGNALDKHSNVVFDGSHCATAVGTATGFTCPADNNGTPIRYPADIPSLLPRIPTCNGTSYVGIDGLVHPQAGKDGSAVNGFDHKFGPGLYCVDNAGANIHDTVTGNGVTFYIRDQNFTMKYNGGGSFAAQAPTSGEYAGVLVFSNVTPTPCTQNMEFRGNGSEPIVGTIFLPSACINWLGNSTGSLSRTQVIGYDVYSNGNADISINYNAKDNFSKNLPGRVELTK